MSARPVLAGAGLLACVLALGLLGACAPPPAPPTPAPPTATPVPTPSQNAAAQMGEQPSDVADVFGNEVRDLTEEVLYLSGGDCRGLQVALADDPSMIARDRAYADTLRKLSHEDQALATPNVADLVGDLDQAFEKLDRILSNCNLKA